MSILSFVIWSANPDIFIIPGLDHPVRWYGLLFASGFIISQQLMQWFFRSEGRDEKDVDQLTMYMIIGTVVGARIGHCLFYNPDYYLSNPLDILKIWEGGLASHGGVIGILTVLYLYSRKKTDQSYYWILDKIAIVVFICGALIRFGNFMNSEIIGLPTGSDYGVVFTRSMEDLLVKSNENVTSVNFEKGGEAVSNQSGRVPIKIVIEYDKSKEFNEKAATSFFENNIKSTVNRYASLSDHIYMDKTERLIYKLYKANAIQYAEIHTLGIARHPAQLYESIYCLILFFLFLHIWYWHRNKFNEGFIFGLWMVILWSLRFTDEFFKENQEAFEEGMTLNMGQLLSIPLVIFGIWIVVNKWKKPVVIS